MAIVKGDTYVYLEVEISGVNIGRMIFKLYTKECPRAAENFRALCTGEAGAGLTTRCPLHFKGSKFHRIISGFMAQGGDFELGDGRGGESIYGGKFKDEAGGLQLRHSQRGMLSMANSGRDSNGSQFFILFKAQHHLNGKHCVFGELVEGHATLDAIEGVKTQSNARPIGEVVISKCGQLERRVIGTEIRKRKKSEIEGEKEEKEEGSSGSDSSSDSSDKKKKKKKKAAKKEKKDKKKKGKEKEKGKKE
mmetsp:Transcript_40737/g.93750  ORF Transcript_40737/g.93750 Transcript_40737/m.93750 type:complete len:249 (-) Transcript_40737:49-795(-)